MEPDNIVLKLPSEEKYDSVSCRALDLFHLRQMLSEEVYSQTSELLHEIFRTLAKHRSEADTITIDCTCGDDTLRVKISDDSKGRLPDEATEHISGLHKTVKVNKKSITIVSPTN